LGGIERIGLAGANGSLFVNDCNVSVGGDPQIDDSIGMLIDGGFADTFVANFEATSLNTGIRVAGRAQEMGSAAVSGHANLHIRMPVIDQCGRYGIEICETSLYSLIDIADPYVAVANGAEAAIRLDAVAGATTIVGGQVIARSDGARSAAGVLATNVSGIEIQGLKIADFAVPVSIDKCKGMKLSGQIVNFLQASKKSAVRVSGSSNVVISFRIAGGEGAFRDGVELIDRDGVGILVDVTMIEPTAIVGERVIRAGTAIRGTGKAGGLVVAGV
jgi:hypothetical protein